MSARSVGLIAILASATLMATSTSAWADGDNKKGEPAEWSAELGAVVVFKPDYEGSDDYEVAPLPKVKLSWRDRVWISGPGIYARALERNNFTADFGIRYEGGRDEDANDALEGLGDLDVGAVAVGTFKYEMGPFSTGMQLDYDLTGDRDGATVMLDANYRTKFLDKKGSFSLGPYMVWANDDYMSNTFGISSSQAASSIAGLSQYDAEAGIKDVGLKAQFGYAITDNISAMTFVKYSRLMGDAADSPLVADEGSANQGQIGLEIVYKW